MKTSQITKIWMVLTACLLVTGIQQPPAQPESAAPPMVVGRVYNIEGSLLRYIPETKDWVAMAPDAPFAAAGTLYSGTEGRAELIVPNQTWVRIGNSTQIQFIGLASDLTEVDVASGEARFGNKSNLAVIKATSDFGYVLAGAGTIFDFCVGDNSVEVIAIKGTVTFVHSAGAARYGVAAGSLSLLADAKQVTSGDGAVDADWNRWNAAREAFWAEKAQAEPRSAKYLPPTLHDESYVLDENGQWDTVTYEGQQRVFWRPMHVSAGWAPYTVGRWTDWDGDQTWIPAEPFGYMTHHYGNWVYVGSAWYWVPPVVNVSVGLPLLDVGFYWNPGRVSWIHTEAYVGWVPLAPQETYYSHRRWGGRHDEVIADVNINVNVNIRAFAFIGHAIVVEQNHFSDVRDYSRVRVTNINQTTIINNYHAAPVVNNTVINNYTINNNRYNYTNVTVKEKPHASVIARIDRNDKAIHGGKPEKASAVQQQVTVIREGRINRDAKIAAPVITDRIVPASEVSRPQSEVKFKQREVKAKGGRESQPTSPAKETKKVEPSKSGREDRPVLPARETKKVEPPKSEREDRPVPPARETKKVEPPKSEREDRPVPPARETKKVEPPKSEREDRPTPPTAEPKKAEPPKAERPEKPAPPVAEPKKAQPPKSGREDRPAPPAAEPKKAEPPKADRPEKPAPPAAEPKKVEPSKSGREDRPAPPAAEPKKSEPPKADRPEKPALPAPPADEPDKVQPSKGGKGDSKGPDKEEKPGKKN